MDDHIQARIVKISLPASGGDKHWHFTGYVLCDGLIITCRHGFVRKAEFDDEFPIKIVCQSGAIKQEVSFSGRTFADLLATGEDDPDKLILFESEDFDVALLACPEIKAVYHPLCLRQLPDKGDWISGGFPRFNKSGEANGYELFGGTHLGSKQTGCYLNITVTEPKLASDDDWKDASGSPIFIDNQLVGVLEKYRAGAKGSFVVGYLKRLWEDDDGDAAKFKALIEQFCPELVFNFHREKLNSLIGKLDSLKIKGRELLQKEIPDIVGEFKQIQTQDQGQSFDVTVLAALSAKYEQSPRFLSSPDADNPFVDVPVARPHTSEFLMAAESQRDPGFSKKTEVSRSGKTVQKVVADTKYSLACPPEFGIKGYKHDDVVSSLLAADANERSVIARLFGDYEADETRDYGYDDHKFIANDILDSEQGKYYWPVRVKPDQNAVAIKAVSEALPLLHILKLSNELKLDREEEKLFRELLAFIKD